MDKSHPSVANRVCALVLRPLASMLLRCGMTWKEFSELSKSQFVKTATQEFGIGGRPTNVSRVSILTGISRKEVKRQRELLKLKQPTIRTKTTDATRVMSAWHQDSDYVNADLTPLVLSELGPMPSFESLCKAYGGDIAASTMVKELLITETIERTKGGLLQAKRRYYQPARADEASLMMAAKLLRDLADSANEDLFSKADVPPRFLGYADNANLPASSIPSFQEFLNDRGQAFLEEVDAWLTANEQQTTGDETDFVRLGVGAFTIQDSNKE